MKQEMWQLWRYTTATVEEKTWAWDLTDRRASGKALGGEYTEMETIHHCPEELGWDRVRQFCNILPISPFKLGVFVYWKQSGTSICPVGWFGLVFFFLAMSDFMYVWISQQDWILRGTPELGFHRAPVKDWSRTAPLRTSQCARKPGCCRGTMETTLKLSSDFFLSFHDSGHSEVCFVLIWFLHSSGNLTILSGNENVIYKNSMQKSDN